MPGKLTAVVVGALALSCGLLAALVCYIGSAQGTSTLPVFEVVPMASSIKFSVKASVGIKGTFDKWEAKMTFASPDVTTGRRRTEKKG